MINRVVLKHGVAALVAAAFVLPLSSAGAAPGGLKGLTRVSEDKIVDGVGLHHSERRIAAADRRGQAGDDGRRPALARRRPVRRP